VSFVLTPNIEIKWKSDSFKFDDTCPKEVVTKTKTEKIIVVSFINV